MVYANVFCEQDIFYTQCDMLYRRCLCRHWRELDRRLLWCCIFLSQDIHIQCSLALVEYFILKKIIVGLVEYSYNRDLLQASYSSDTCSAQDFRTHLVFWNQNIEVPFFTKWKNITFIACVWKAWLSRPLSGGYCLCRSVDTINCSLALLLHVGDLATWAHLPHTLVTPFTSLSLPALSGDSGSEVVVYACSHW